MTDIDAGPYASATLYLGTHEAHWVSGDTIDGPLFISAVRLRRRPRKSAYRPANRPWALDSGGFTELSKHGRWSISPGQYIAETDRFVEEIGQLAWCAPQDWMCEPSMLAKTGLTVADHQMLTIENWLDLETERPGRFIPVLQGWTLADYLTHAEQYASIGVDLTSFATVGVGSVCRRGQDDEIVRILGRLSDDGIRCHGFGVRGSAFKRLRHRLASADSMAWSYNARKNPPMEGCTHKSCGNCPRWAKRWRDRLLDETKGPKP